MNRSSAQMLGSLRETPTATPGSRARSGARARLGASALPVTGALTLATTLWLGLWNPNLADWGIEARPSVNDLLGGHLGGFLQRAPAYGGSLLLRAPFLELARLSGGGSTAVYRAGAIPCLAALMVLGVWLSGQLGARGGGRLARAATLVLCVANPIAVAALQQAHPEEILGAALCVAAVLCAQRDHAVWSGVLVGAAIANKPWGVLAAGPVLIALASARPRAIMAMAVTAGLILTPFLLDRAGGVVSQGEAVGLHAGQIFNPQQLWWFLGSASRGTPGGRHGPPWLAGLGHTLPVAIMPPLTLGYALLLRARPAQRRHDALLLLALLLLLRCVLDPWDTIYYPAPFLGALLAWESTTYDRPPLIAMLAALLTWLAFDGARFMVGESGNALAATSAIATLCALGAIGRRLLSSASVSATPSTADAEPHSVARTVLPLSI